MTFNENDLLVIGKIQELRNSTLESAKQTYRRHLQKLANPDIENRHELVWSSVNKTAEVASDEEVEAAVTEKKPTRNERRLAKKEKTMKKKTKTKATPKPRVEVPLVKLEREVELAETSENHVYTANLFGKKHAVILIEHDCQSASGRFAPIGVSSNRLAAAKQFAKEGELPVAICAIKRVNKRAEQGYAVPLDLYVKFRNGDEDRQLFGLNGEARQAYAEGGWAGCKFSVKSAEAKAA